ncbi:GNAT family N-acetyltransferase [Methanococcoides sp. LMO-2]|uniref:GNAT family N-acetyltransferase n=1 Tax=Methanococcoides cohabitans TaxID=3136559 RepID=A0ABU9KPV6_9EURY
MSEIIIRELREDEIHLWDDIVAQSPQGTIVHEISWLRIIEKHTNSNLHLLIGCLGSEIIAAIPLFSKKKYFLNGFYSPISGAMIQHLGPIFPNYDSLKQDKKEYYFREFCLKLDHYLNSNKKSDFILIETSPNLLDARPFVWNRYDVTPKYNYVKNIEDLDSTWNDLKKQIRKNILNCEKNDVEVYEGNLEDYNFIIESLSRRLSEQEVELPPSKDYFLDLYHKYYPDNLKIFMAKYDGNPVTGIIATTYKDKISIWVGATRTDTKGIYPVDLIQWKIMEWGHKMGYKYCEIQGANMPSISYFKSRYNFDLEIYYSAKKENRKVKIALQFKKLYGVVEGLIK